MLCVILAAGKGIRMGELTKDTPKPTLKAKDYPEKGYAGSIIGFTIKSLASLRDTPPDTTSHIEAAFGASYNLMPEAVTEIIVVVGYLQDKIKEKIGLEHPEKKISYVEQKELKGTAHALSICKDKLQGRFLVLMGDDIYVKEDLEKLVSKKLGILVKEISEESKDDFGARVEVSNNGALKDITERQKLKSGDLANCGAYVLDERYFDLPLVAAGNKTDEYGLPQTFLQMVKAGARFEIVKASFWKKITTSEDLVTPS